MLKFVLMYALIYDYSPKETHIVTIYATKELCEITRKSLSPKNEYSCIPHQVVVAIPK